MLWSVRIFQLSGRYVTRKHKKQEIYLGEMAFAQIPLVEAAFGYVDAQRCDLGSHWDALQPKFRQLDVFSTHTGMVHTKVSAARHRCQDALSHELTQ